MKSLSCCFLNTLPPSPFRSHVDTLPYQALLESRELSDITLLVIHCTELPELSDARTMAEEVLYPSGTGNSGHFYIDRDGSISQYVALERIAHHVHGYNASSIGIELVNRGRFPNWWHLHHQTMTEEYPEPQIQSLIHLIHALQNYIPTLKTIAGHEQLDTRDIPATDQPVFSVRRKLDPGICFPWKKVLNVIQLRYWE